MRGHGHSDVDDASGIDAATARRTTPGSLIVAAERLFAQHGLEGASLRQIAVAAGQRNPGVVHYHFGSKQELLRAIVEHRLPGINRRRMQLLRASEAEGRGGDPRALIESIVVPILEADEGGGYYARFLAALVARPDLSGGVFEALDESIGSSIDVVRQWIPRVLRHLPEPIGANRSALCMRFVLSSLAMRQEQEEQGTATLSRAAFVQDLVDAAAGLLTADSTASLTR